VWGSVGRIEVGLDLDDEIGHGVKHSAAQRLVGEFSKTLSVDGDILEDLGSTAFRITHWAGEHPCDDGEYAERFHPSDLGDTALAELFGFHGEGGAYLNPDLVDQDAVVLNGFRLGEIGSACGPSTMYLAHTENGSTCPDPTAGKTENWTVRPRSRLPVGRGPRRPWRSASST
jgi:hypothetical protein